MGFYVQLVQTCLLMVTNDQIMIIQIENALVALKLETVFSAVHTLYIYH